MTTGYLLVQIVSIGLLLHLPLGLAASGWLYRKHASVRELICWGALIWLLPTVGAIAAFVLFNRSRTSPAAKIKHA